MAATQMFSAAGALPAISNIAKLQAMDAMATIFARIGIARFCRQAVTW
jgi:exonuclease I